MSWCLRPSVLEATSRPSLVQSPDLCGPGLPTQSCRWPSMVMPMDSWSDRKSRQGWALPPPAIPMAQAGHRNLWQAPPRPAPCLKAGASRPWTCFFQVLDSKGEPLAEFEAETQPCLFGGRSTITAANSSVERPLILCLNGQLYRSADALISDTALTADRRLAGVARRPAAYRQRTARFPVHPARRLSPTQRAPGPMSASPSHQA